MVLVMGLLTQMAASAKKDIDFPRKGMLLWLAADDQGSLKLNPENKLLQWEDKSGAGRHAVAEVNAPSFDATGLNGSPAIWFDGKTSFLKIPDLGANRMTVTIFVVFSKPERGGNYPRVLSSSDGVTDDHLSSGILVMPFDQTQEGALTNKGVAVCGPKVLMQVYKNKWGKELRIGCVSPRNIVNFKGFVSEILVYDGELDRDEQEDIKSILSNKWLVKGDQALPIDCTVFAPFEKADGVPTEGFLQKVPAALELGGRRAEAKKTSFDANRSLNLASFLGVKGGAAVGKTAFVYIPFTAKEAGPATFGFGADWWYEAYLDGKLISETLTKDGNGLVPPSIRDFTAMVELTQGEHLLVIRFLSGSGSSLLAVGGSLDIKNPEIKTPPRIADNRAHVTKAATLQGPPPGKKWKLVWNDEFDGTAIDMKRWQNNPEKSWNIPGMQTRYSAENCALDGKGSLVLRLTRDDDGTIRFNAGLQSRSFEKAFGYFETRVQFSTQPGWWSSVWLSGVPYNEGRDTFQSPQEIDIFEDFYKPKTQNDISHCYHATAGLSIITNDQGDAKGIGDGNMMARSKISRFSKGKMVCMEEYGGWHTVAVEWSPLEHIFYVDGQETLRQTYKEVPMTTAPQRVWISECLRYPTKSQKDGGAKPFYGWLEDAKFPDQLVVDYVRVYDEDLGNKMAPSVTVTVDGNADELRLGQPATFRVRADASEGAIKTVYLFSSGYIRAEANVEPVPAGTQSWWAGFIGMFSKPGHAIDQTFSVSNLFEDCNTIIAMAKDNDGRIGLSAPLLVNVLTGREYTGAAYQGKPQLIPGKIIAGHYDEGGNGVAFRNCLQGDLRLTWRKEEIKGSEEMAIPAGGANPLWVTYRVLVKEAGVYDVELLMNRPDYQRKGVDFTGIPDDVIQLDVDKVKAAEWKLPAGWDSGAGFRQPIKPVGKQRVTLTAGEHQLIVRFDRVRMAFTYFGGFEFVRKNGEAP